MNSKLILAIVVILLLSVGLLVAQNNSTSFNKVDVTKNDMDSWLSTMPPDQIRQISATPDAKKQLVDHLKEVFVLSQEADRLGISARTDVQNDIDIMQKVLLASIYRERDMKKNPKAQEVTPKERDEYLANNPTAWDQFVNSNARLKAAPPEQRDALKPQFAELMVLVDRAKAAGMDKDPGYLMAVKVNRATYLSNHVQQEMHNNIKVNDEDLKAYYDAHKDEFQETRARHILIMFPDQRKNQQQQQQQDANSPIADKSKPQTKEEAQKLAQDLLARIKKGEDFATLAKQYSDDTGSASQGGDLGFFRKDVQFVPEFKDAVFKLKPGEVSDIVQTTFGYHIIKVEEQRTAAFDEAMKEELKEKVSEKKLEDQVAALKARNLVTVDESFNLPVQAAPPPAPAGMTPPGMQGMPQQDQPPAQPGPPNGQEPLE